METKDEVAGVKAKKKRAVVVPVADDPENQFISKADFVKKRNREKAANAAAEEARIKALKDYDKKEEGSDADPLAPLRKKLASAEKALAKTPTSKAFQKKVKDLAEELESAEMENE